MYNLVLKELEKNLKSYNTQYYDLYVKISFLYEFLNGKDNKNFKIEILDIFYNLKSIDGNSDKNIEYIRKEKHKDRLINILFIYVWYKKMMNHEYGDDVILGKIEKDYLDTSEYRKFKLNLVKINEVIELKNFNEDNNKQIEDEVNKVEITIGGILDFVEFEYNAMCKEFEVYNNLEEIIIRICIDGAFFYSYDNSTKQILVKKGDVLLCNRFIMNKATFLTNRCKFLAFRVKDTAILDILNKKFEKNSVNLTMFYNINELFVNYDSDERELYLLKILFDIVNQYQKDSRNLKCLNFDYELDDILKYISINIEEKLTVKEIEKNCRVYNKILISKFKRYLDILPSEYILEQKLLRAAMLLKTTDYKIGYISDKLSFASSNTFAISFRRKFGISPLKYRNKK